MVFRINNQVIDITTLRIGVLTNRLGKITPDVAGLGVFCLIKTTVLQHEIRFRCARFGVGGSILIKIVIIVILILLLHGVNYIQVLDSTSAHYSSLRRQVTQRCRVVTLTVYLDLVALCPVLHTHCVFMTARCLGGIGIEIIFIHQWTVIHAQIFQLITRRIGRGTRQRTTHNLPSVTVEQHKYWRDVGSLNIEDTSTHIESLIPVFYILHYLLFVTVRFVVISIPTCCVGISFITMPTAAIHTIC